MCWYSSIIELKNAGWNIGKPVQNLQLTAGYVSLHTRTTNWPYFITSTLYAWDPYWTNFLDALYSTSYHITTHKITATLWHHTYTSKSSEYMETPRTLHYNLCQWEDTFVQMATIWLWVGSHHQIHNFFTLAMDFVIVCHVLVVVHMLLQHEHSQWLTVKMH